MSLRGIWPCRTAVIGGTTISCPLSVVECTGRMSLDKTSTIFNIAFLSLAMASSIIPSSLLWVILGGVRLNAIVAVLLLFVVVVIVALLILGGGGGDGCCCCCSYVSYSRMIGIAILSWLRLLAITKVVVVQYHMVLEDVHYPD
jgi:hypothetical protein